MQLDLESFDSVRSFVDNFRKKEIPLHILVNNAGKIIAQDSPLSSRVHVLRNR